MNILKSKKQIKLLLWHEGIVTLVHDDFLIQLVAHMQLNALYKHVHLKSFQECILKTSESWSVTKTESCVPF